MHNTNSRLTLSTFSPHSTIPPLHFTIPYYIHPLNLDTPKENKQLEKLIKLDKKSITYNRANESWTALTEDDNGEGVTLIVQEYAIAVRHPWSPGCDFVHVNTCNNFMASSAILQ